MKKTFYIAGVQFRPVSEIRDAVRIMKPGDYLLIEQEPTNKFDPNAIKLIFKEEFESGNVSGEETTFLGYVPKKYSAELSGLLDIGMPITCRVDEVNPSASPWEMIKVTVLEEEEGQEEGREPDYVDEGGSVS